jgi:hypothetical protein
VIEAGQRGAQVVGKWKLCIRIADCHYALHDPTADEQPVHVVAGAVHADVVQGCKSLATEEVEVAQIQHELFGNTGVALDEAAKGTGIGGVELADRGDEQSRLAQVPHGKSGTSTTF